MDVQRERRPAARRSLVEALDNGDRKSPCRLCALPPDVQTEVDTYLREVRDSGTKIRMTGLLGWLKDDVGVTATQHNVREHSGHLPMP